ncbi:hypothetical protein EDC18_102253 [Natranaerovirga pectinivora]|uniref:Uncharacterized protein n=1 Tax=Natranaerovirga pectinivora TaxID=682400 RepID=A0A4R3MQQ8_9FIRM|nr:hypothetical protein [Natranaerovirga pectinivora]TCT16236.1 hypothetical protein EDC18_102253 [Natranaerovirga pectinivora]
MKVKIISGDDIEVIQEVINDFIKDKNVIDIKTSESMVKGIPNKYNYEVEPESILWSYSVLIMYKEQEWFEQLTTHSNT